MSATTDKVRIIFGELTLGAAAGNAHYLFSYQTGGMESLKKDGREWVYRTPKPTFWRALTDNDRGSHFHLKSGMWLAADMFIAHIGTSVAVNGKQIELPRPPVSNQYGRDEFADTVTVTFTYETITAPKTTAEISYTVHGSGKLDVSCTYHGKAGLPQLPAFGFRMIMPTHADGFRYKGLSGETYPDRKLGGVPGVYDVKGLPVTPYLVPQECGMHMDTEWLEIMRHTVLDNARHDNDPFSLRISMKDNVSFAFSCLPYTAEELENALHQEELPPARRTVLCIYGGVRGIGGIDSWGTDVEEQYHLSAEKDIKFSFSIEN